MKQIVLCFFLLVSLNVSAQKLNKDEQRILVYIRQAMPETMQLLQQIVNINSGTLNVVGVKAVGEVLRKKFDEAGFKTEWSALPDSLKRAGHLVAFTKPDKTKGKRLLLIGHLDTVFEPDMPKNPYTILNDSTATGQGLNDMKGGNVIILAALQALQKAGALKNADITAYFMGDEEKAGIPSTVSRANFIERAKQVDIALGFETAQSLSTVATARRGSSSWTLKVSGKQAHSSGVFNNNFGAIYEAARIVNQFREALSKEKYLTFNPGVFVGGSEVQFDENTNQYLVSGKSNIISPTAIVSGDLRFLSEDQKNAAREKMIKIVTQNNLASTSAIISFSDGIPSMEPTKGNEGLVQILNKVSVDMGLGSISAGDPGSRGAGDISYVAQYVNSLDGLGASGKGAHAPGETLNLREYPLLVERAAIFIYRLLQ